MAACRFSFLFVLLAACVSVVLVQHVSYPLHIGDRWAYRVSGESSVFEISVIGDSVLPDELASGVYYYRLAAAGFVQTRKTVVMR